MSDEKKEHYLYRDAITGEFVTEEFAKANPFTTIREKVELLNETCHEKK